jgi:hypothetical protein
MNLIFIIIAIPRYLNTDVSSLKNVILGVLDFEEVSA